MGNGKIVTLCGSARKEFEEAFNIAAANEVLAGNVVLGLSCRVADLPPPVRVILDAKRLFVGLREGHKRKIQISDEILVINQDGYIGEQTENEIAYAKNLGKTVRYFQQV